MSGVGDGVRREEGSLRASDLFVRCLEAEGVEYVFGLPGCMTWESGQHGSIVRKREKRFGRHMVVPTDYSLDVAIVEELGTEIVRT
jgi:hypothetical protein